MSDIFVSVICGVYYVSVVTVSDRSRKKGGEQSLYAGMLTREEVERQLDAKKPVMGIEKAQATLPMEIFSTDNSIHPGEIVHEK